MTGRQFDEFDGDDMPHETATSPYAPTADSNGSAPKDDAAIRKVLGLRHRTGSGRHECLCKECHAIKRVCALARERLAIPPVRRQVRKAHEQISIFRAAIADFLVAHDAYVLTFTDAANADYAAAMRHLRLLATAAEPNGHDPVSPAVGASEPATDAAADVPHETPDIQP